MMDKPKKEPNQPAGDSDIVDTGAENSEKKVTSRRLQDAIDAKNPNRKMNLDRRANPNDRRTDIDPQYKGPARRYSIDSRNPKERGDKD